MHLVLRSINSYQFSEILTSSCGHNDKIEQAMNSQSRRDNVTEAFKNVYGQVDNYKS